MGNVRGGDDTDGLVTSQTGLVGLTFVGGRYWVYPSLAVAQQAVSQLPHTVGDSWRAADGRRPMADQAVLVSPPIVAGRHVFRAYPAMAIKTVIQSLYAMGDDPQPGQGAR